MSGARDRYDSGKRTARRDVGADGLTYEQQREPSPATCRAIQDDFAVHILWRAFGRIENNCADDLDRYLAQTFLAAFDDGSLVDMQVTVSTYRASQLVERVKKFRQSIGFTRTGRPKRKTA